MVLESEGNDGDGSGKEAGETEAEGSISLLSLSLAGCSLLSDGLLDDLKGSEARVKVDDVELVVTEVIEGEVEVLEEVLVTVSVEVDDGTETLLGVLLEGLLDLGAGVAEVLLDVNRVTEDGETGLLDSLSVLGKMVTDVGEEDVCEFIVVLVLEDLLGSLNGGDELLGGDSLEVVIVAGAETVGEGHFVGDGKVDVLDELAGTELFGAEGEGEGDVGGEVTDALLGGPNQKGIVNNRLG